MSKKMDISLRTIEFYITNVKDKFAWESSHELFDQLNSAKLKTELKEMFNLTKINLLGSVNQFLIN